MTTERQRSDWSGEWISADDAVPSGLHRTAFRRSITLTEPPAELRVRVSADARYVLWLNGIELGRGPARAQPGRWSHDEFDFGPALREGVNELAVLVSYYVQDTAIWQRARVTEGLGTRAALIVDTAGALPLIDTGPGWTAATLPAWTGATSGGFTAGLPVEIVDLRLIEQDWQRSAAFAATLPPARPARAMHLGGRGRARPPVHPFGALRPRRTATPTGSLLRAQSTGRRRVDEGEPTDDPVAGVLRAWESAQRVAAGHRPGRASTYVEIFDFGRVVGGFLEVDLVAPPGSFIDLAYLERPIAEVAAQRFAPRTGARVVTTEGVSSFRALEWSGMRFVAILVRSATDDPVAVDTVRVQEHLSPFGAGASFRTDDADLQRLWHAGVRTVQLNCVDAFTDCPTREQRTWVGDPVVHAEVVLVASTDWRSIEHHLDLTDSPRADGLLPMAVACDVEAGGGFTIPDWSLHWVHTLWLYARATAQHDAARRHLATASRILAWFEQFADEQSVLTDVPEWTLGDWSSVFTAGRSAILTGLWARALGEYAELADWCGNAADARAARARHRAVVAGFECFWDPARGLYVDHIIDGVRHPATSQVANAAAIVGGVVPAERCGGIIERITDETRLVTRGWDVASPTVSAEQKQADRAAGHRRIDWDVATQIVRAEPFFTSVLHDAVAVSGRAELIPGLLRRWLRFLKDGYDTFGECWEWGTPCHGWSSTPTRDLIVHVIGARPAILGSLTYRIAPVRTDIGYIAADIPTARGLLEVMLEGAVLTVNTPLPVEVHRWTGELLPLPPGAYRIDLLAAADPLGQR